MKLRFLTTRDTPLASADTYLIDALRTELLRRPGMVEVDDFESADAIVLHEPWDFREWRYVDTLEADPVVGRYPHKIYTFNCDDAATGLLRGIYTCLRQSRFDPKLHAAVPFLAQPNKLVTPLAGVVERATPYLATWRGNPKSNSTVRGHVLALGARSPAFKAESTESWLNHGADEQQSYVDLLRSGKFSLCPGGWAPATIRIFESMALGVAPVLIADEFVEPVGPDWRSISIKVREADLDSLESKLMPYADQHREWGARAHEAWQRYFHPDRISAYYADAMLNCIRSNAGTGSPAAEIARWRSRRMYSTNGWTLSQRVMNKVKKVLHRGGSRALPA